MTAKNPFFIFLLNFARSQTTARLPQYVTEELLATTDLAATTNGYSTTESFNKENLYQFKKNSKICLSSSGVFVL